MAVVPAGLHHVQIGSGADVRERRLHVAAGGESAIHMEWPTPPPAAEPTTATAPASSVVAPVAVPSGRVKPDAPPRTKAPAAPEPPGRAEAHAPTDRGESARARVTSTTAFRPVPSGWLAVTSAFPVQVYENGVEVARDASGRLVLAAGTHSLTLSNDALEFRQEQEVTIVARRAVSVALDTPTGVLHVNAQPWATVWVDGRRVGDTPIGNLALPIGEHEVVLRHPNLGEERRSVSVGARTPVRVGVEFKP
jgi:PEGA domain